MPTDSNLDAALRTLREFCIARDFERADITVRQDGRVYVSFLDGSGFHIAAARALLDAEPGDGLELPSVAIGRLDGWRE